MLLRRIVEPLVRPGICAPLWESSRYDTLIDNGAPEHRLDVAIIGDGYAREEMGLYRADVDAIIDAFHSIEPIKSYSQHFNFHRINLLSPTSGTNDSYSDPPVRTRTPLGTHFSFIDKRRLVGWDWRVWQMARRSGVPFDSLLVVVNTKRYGGATRFWLTVGYASRHGRDFPRVMVHEAGHSIAKLNDEYVDAAVPSPRWLRWFNRLPNLMPFANVTTNPKSPPWRAWLGEGLTTEAQRGREVGAVEGGCYVDFGVFRPCENCMMRNHDYPFCPVCQEQWIKKIYEKSAIADGQMPGRDVVGDVGMDVGFDAAMVRGDGKQIETTWAVRTPFGKWLTVQETADYAPLTYSFEMRGRWCVECKLVDRNARLRTPKVIRKTAQTLRWIVTVN